MNAKKTLSYSLPASIAAAVSSTIDEWRGSDKVRRMWMRDATVWTGADEGEWLGWLRVTDEHAPRLRDLETIAAGAKEFSHVLLMGMGGSSLCPEVLARTFGPFAGFPELFVLDSTDPAQVRAVQRKVDPSRTLFIVSSKSGGTLEPQIFKQYFMKCLQEAVGKEKSGAHFVAITDPGSKLQTAAEAGGFRHLAFGVPSIGGRYSALSAFGMLPAAVMGLDLSRFMDRVDRMVRACSPSVPPEENPGVVLGAILGACAGHGRDKLTLVTSPRIGSLGAWLEQLVAESTGKNGKGVIPVDRERLGPPDAYGDDRLFAHLRLETEADAEQDAAVSALEKGGQPVVRIAVSDIYDLGQVFYLWEFATAVACSIMGINPFDQPDVEASKVAMRKLTAEYEQRGSLPAETPLLDVEGVKLFADERNAAALAKAAGSNASLAGCLRAHLDRIGPGDYFALLAFIESSTSHREELQAIRHAVRDAAKVATCLGFGPRFLHSTGQAYKGGPNSGLFLQITCDDAEDLPVPGQRYTFGVVKAAQARGDFQVLAERDRRALRVHLGADVRAGLAVLRRAVEQALA